MQYAPIASFELSLFQEASVAEVLNLKEQLGMTTAKLEIMSGRIEEYGQRVVNQASTVQVSPR